MRSLFALATLAAVLSPTLCGAADLLTLRVVKAESGHDLKDSSRGVTTIRVGESSTEELAKWTSRHVGETVSVLIDGRGGAENSSSRLANRRQFSNHMGEYRRNPRSDPKTH
jgi:hypothetical protein